MLHVRGGSMTSGSSLSSGSVRSFRRETLTEYRLSYRVELPATTTEIYAVFYMRSVSLIVLSVDSKLFLLHSRHG